jgi:hypothetical protein
LSSLIDAIQRALAVIVDGSVQALAGLGSTAALIIISIVCGSILAIAYGKLVSQERLRAVKRDISSGMLEVILFRHNFKLAVASQFRMLIGGLKYFLLAIPPILILAIPSIFLLSQLNSWFGYAALGPGESVLVRADLTSSTDLNSVSLASQENVKIVGPLHDQSNNELFWRVEPKEEGLYSLNFSAPNGSAVPVLLSADSKLRRVTPLVSTHASDRLFFPTGENIKLPSELSKLEIIYPARSLKFLGFHSNWIVLFLIFSIAGGYFAAKVVGVEL